MKIDRWTAEISPSLKIICQLLESEGLDPQLVLVKPGAKVTHRRTLMIEVIQMTEGELIFNLSGSQFVLRSGDRLELASNTLYSYSNLKAENAGFYSAQRL